jgi:hypothetical protein
VVEVDRPEGARRDVGRQVQLVRLSAVQELLVGVDEGSRVHGAGPGFCSVIAGVIPVAQKTKNERASSSRTPSCSNRWLLPTNGVHQALSQ